MEFPPESDMRIQSLRGMADLTPNSIHYWHAVEALAARHFRNAGINEIRTPILESTDLFCRGIGEATDIVGKEMYTFHDRGGRTCTLRPEGTASVARAVIQNGLLTQGPQRLWYGGPMFRYERPQAGRQRQFHQIGLELLGFGDVRSDVEAIAIAWDLLKDLGVGGLILELNTLGTFDDRSRYRHKLVEFLQRHRDQLDPDSQERLERNPLRILDSKNPDTQALLADAPTLAGALDSSSHTRYERVQAALKSLDIPFRLNPRLVRGLDYYSHTAFEITSSQLGAQATVCGGGRYDGLIEQLGGPPTPAIGWALGMERLVILLAQGSADAISAPVPDLYLVNRGEAAEAAALLLARGLRLRGLHVELDAGISAFGKQFKRADRSGAPWAAVLGEEELAAGQVQLKPLRDPALTETRLPLADLDRLVALVRP